MVFPTYLTIAIISLFIVICFTFIGEREHVQQIDVEGSADTSDNKTEKTD
jgi:hypothetical protein